MSAMRNNFDFTHNADFIRGWFSEVVSEFRGSRPIATSDSNAALLVWYLRTDFFVVCRIVDLLLFSDH